ncbi:MAG TPA: chemotaxis protein CheX [Mycobacteriales bacterium]|nr:chemotaxis protein CheX [Mycobacteriales bacterium]
MTSEAQVVTVEQVVAVAEEVWSSLLGEPLVPLLVPEQPGSPEDAGRTSGRVLIRGAWEGGVVLAGSARLARTVAAAMFDLPQEQLTDDEVRDAFGELTNMVGGGIKSLVPGPSTLSLPAVSDDAGALGAPGREVLGAVRLRGSAGALDVAVWGG